MSVMPQHSFRSAVPVTLDEAAARFPTINADAPYGGVSSRYSLINTRGVLSSLTAEGFQIVAASVAKTRKEDKRGFERHLITLRHPDFALPQHVGEVIPELILRNSHDGTSAYELFLGMFRLVCANGLMVGHAFGGYRVAHKGDVAHAVTNAAFAAGRQLADLSGHVDAMRSRNMSAGDIAEFQARALALRFGDGESPFSPNVLNVTRRAEDQGESLWTVYNRTQENVLRGGFRAWTTGANGRPRRTSMRSVTGMAANVSINRGLFDLAVSYEDVTPRPAVPLSYAA